MNPEISIRTNSLVILADSHNPTLFTDSFLIRSGMMHEGKDRITPGGFIITPALARITLQKPKAIVTITLDPGTLRIDSLDNEIPYELGEKYCKNLNNIIGVAYGINIDFQINNIESKVWFEERETLNLGDSYLRQLVYRKNEGNQELNIHFEYLSETNINVKFNFHTNLNKSILGTVSKLVELRKQNGEIAMEIINKAFKV